MKRIYSLLFIILLLFPCNSFANDKPVKQWNIYEIELTAEKTYDNPYVGGLPDTGKNLVTVTFTGTSNVAEGMKYTVAGFWDGGQMWRVRFAPPVPGQWSYESISEDPGLNGIRGSFFCTGWSEAEKEENPTRRGFIRVSRSGIRPGRHFEYTDGTPFLWIGDTWWNWCKKDIHFSTFQKLVDNRVSKGFSLGQLWVSGHGGRKNSPLDRTHDILDVEHMRKIEKMIAYANSRGMTVWVHGWWARKDLNKQVSPEQIRRWCRYLINRLGAYNVIWVLCGEYTLYDYSGFGLNFWKDLGRMINNEDPYERIISTHANPSIYVFPDDSKTAYYSTGDLLHNELWLDYNQIQSGHSKWRNEMIPSQVIADYARVPHKPVVVTEPWYEFTRGDPTGDWQQKAHANIVEEIIFGAWSAVLSGAAGHSYGGGNIWWARLPESPERGSGNWGTEKNLDNLTLDYPGAFAIGHMSTFLKKMNWWELEPHPEIVSGYSSQFCSAVPGKEYLVLMRYGGGIKVDLYPSGIDDTFTYEWFDPRTGEILTGGTVSGGRAQNFVAPGTLPGSQFMWKPIAWILHIKKE